MFTHSQDLSLPLWKLFLPPKSTTNPSGTQRPFGLASRGAESGPVHLYCTQHRQPGNSLDTYITALRAPYSDFIGHIRITARLHADFGVSELMKLATLPNLGVLEIIELTPNRTNAVPSRLRASKGPQGQISGELLDVNQVSDRLLKGWSLTRPVPFPALRALRLWGCRGNMLTPVCLKHAAAFPLLAHFDVSVELLTDQPRMGMSGTWTGVMRTASRFGWTGLRYQTPDVRYSSTQLETKQNTGRSITTLNMVEQQAVPVEALHWGSCLYSFLEIAGYDMGMVKSELSPEAVTIGRVLGETPTRNYALVSLGFELAIKKPSRIRQSAFCFVRGQETLGAHSYTAHAQEQTDAVKAAEEVGNRTKLKQRPTELHTSGGRDEERPRPLAKRRKAGRSMASLLGDFAA